MYTTLYKILQSESIEIPIIQRDYAQGRINKVHLRERMLESLVKALKTNEPLSLDFVYGTKEQDAMWPLDGQQRLTTLWLLHWYLALRTDELSTASQWLRHFTYETRTSSRDFIISLCSIDAKVFMRSKMKIVDFIADQTWYYSKYKQDPTIQGMLRTLGGTRITNSENVDIADGIEEFLGNDTNCLTYWHRLLSDDCPIHFLYKDMKDDDLPLSDDLYIKMNARGKQLTDFENFKADLIGYAPNPDKPNEKLLDIKTASLIDNQWTDVFWKEACDKKLYSVDEIFFKFLRRYFLDRLIATSSLNAEDLTQHPLYQDLYKGKKEYDGLKEYKDVLTEDTVNNLRNLFDRWNEVSVSPHWEQVESFAFIPKYIIKESDENGIPKVIEVSTISQKERAVFHAIVCYFEENETFNPECFDAWKRFAWNIVENSRLQTEDAMIGAIWLFEELRPHCGDIRHFLASCAKVKSNYAERQMKEERFKAQLLTSDSDANLWKPLLHEAENMGFFRGNISCLLRLDKKDFVVDIKVFTQKLAKAKFYFDDKGIKDDYAISLTQALIRTTHRWEQLVNQYLYDSSSEGWKNNILNNGLGYYQEMHELLTAEKLENIPFVPLKVEDGDWIESANAIKRMLSETCFLNQENEKYGKIICTGSKWRIRWIGEVCTFFPSNKHQTFCFDWTDTDNGMSFRRNALLHHSKIEPYANDYEGVFWGWTIDFYYNGNSFQWDYKNDIYLLNRLDHRKKRPHKNENGDEFFCIHMNAMQTITQQGFLIRLTNLAKEAEQ